MSADNPQNPFAISLASGTPPQSKSIGRGGEAFAAQVHGKYYTASYYKNAFGFNRTAVTVPVIATNLVSVFTLYNPPTATVNLELIDVDVGIVLATTVVDTLGFYWQGPTLASLATLTTIGVFGTNWFNGNLGGLAGQANPYSAFTHSNGNITSNIPRVDIVSQFGGVTAPTDQVIHKDYDGKMLLGVGCALSAAMSTAAGTTSGLDLGIRWLEAPVT